MVKKRYCIDLLFFHRRLRCRVAIELKIGKLQFEYVGKMQFYLATGVKANHSNFGVAPKIFVDLDRLVDLDRQED